MQCSKLGEDFRSPRRERAASSERRCLSADPTRCLRQIAESGVDTASERTFNRGPMRNVNMNRTCQRRRVVALVVVGAACGLFGQLNGGLAGTREDRHALWNEIRPVALKNCTLRRFGSVNDGGYLMCENLIAGIE